MIAPIAPAGANGRPGVVTQWTRTLSRRWVSGLVTALIVTAVGLGVLFLTRPRYRAEARLRLAEPPPSPGVSPSAGIVGLLRPGGDPFSNDLELLDSRTVTEGTVDDVALAVRLVAPADDSRDSLVTALTATRATQKARFRVTWEASGTVSVHMTSPTDSAVALGAPGRPITFGGVTATFRPWAAGMPRSIEVRTVLFATAVRTTREDINVERARRDANIVDLTYSSTDPGIARNVLDAAVRRFMALRTAIQGRESGQTVDSLRVVADRAQRDLSAAESQLEAMQRRTRLVAPDAQHRAVVERYSTVAVDVNRGVGELAMLDRVLARVGSGSPAAAWADLVSYPRFLENGTIGGVLTQLVQRQQQRTELASRRTAENRDIRVLDQQIASLDSTLRTLVHGYRAALAQQVGLARTELAALDSTIGAAPQAAVELMRRERDVKVLSDVVVLAQQRLHQEELREALTFSNVQVIDPPALRDKPVWPPVALGLAALALLALASGALAVVAHEAADQTVRSTREIQAALGAPVLLVLSRTADGAPIATRDDVAALLQRAAPADRPAPHLSLAGTHDNGAMGDAAAALVATGAFATARSSGAAGVRTLVVGGAVDQFAAAAAVAATGGPVVLVVECGTTTKDELHRAAELLQQNGAKVVGAIAVCRPGGARDLWD
jgi:tyrosine-protein kinase Etk/Wzc